MPLNRSNVASGEESRQSQWNCDTASSRGSSSAVSSYVDYRYDSIPLPPAGQSSKARQALFDQARTRTSTLQATGQCLSARRIGHDPDDNPGVIGVAGETGRQCALDFAASSKARLNPGSFERHAGQTSARAVTAIHQNLYDIEAQAKNAVSCPRKAVMEKVRNRNENPNHRIEESLKLGVGELVRGRKAEGGCQPGGRTDPITHFATENREWDPFAWWRPSQKRGMFGDSQDQTWTWQMHNGPTNDEKEHNLHPGEEAVRVVRNVGRFGDLVTCRGERMYNMCGAEDMLPAGVYAHIKCDVPPSKSHITHNDKKYLPVCARQDPPVPHDNNCYNVSEKVWSVFRHGAFSEEARQNAAEDAVKHRQRAQSARPVLQTTGTPEPLREDELPMFMRCRRPLTNHFKQANPLTGSKAEEFNPEAAPEPPRPQVPQGRLGPEFSLRPSSAGNTPSSMGRRASSTGNIGASRKDMVAPSPTGSVGGSRRKDSSGNLDASRRRNSNGSLGDTRGSPSSAASPSKAIRRSASDTSMRSANSRPSSTTKASFADLTKVRWRGT